MTFDQGPTPLYYQIKTLLKSKILSGELKANGRFPSETELCSQYNVSRPTIRQALGELINEGLIYRDRGKGTFVTDGVGLKRLSLKGSIENLIAAGQGSRIRVVDYKEKVPPPNIAEILKLERKESVYQLELLRFVPKGPFAYSFIYFPVSLGKVISSEEVKEGTEIITFVESKLKTRVHRANQTIDVGLASQVVGKNLFIKTNTPLLIIERDYYGRDGSPLFASITYCRPDLYKYRIELTRT